MLFHTNFKRKYSYYLLYKLKEAFHLKSLKTLQINVTFLNRLIKFKKFASIQKELLEMLIFYKLSSHFQKTLH